jgi:1-acyl-sn-glycerol-3-phosphate acyltransferase
VHAQKFMETENPKGSRLSRFGHTAPHFICSPCPTDSLTPLNAWGVTKILFATVTLVAPLKFISIFLLLLIGWGLAKIALIGIEQPAIAEPLIGWRSLVLYPIRFGVRLIMFIAGFVYVAVEGSPDDRAKVFVATHQSIWDSMWFIAYFGSSQAAKVELFDIPMMGDFLRVLSSLPVDRQSPEGRKKALSEIKRRAADDRYPKLLVFPEGCCTNGRQIIEFKKGAFEPRVPVQPVGISYPSRHYDLKFTRYMLWDLYRSLCEPVNWMAVTFLTTRYPSPDELHDPTRWASNVREEMAVKLGLQMVDDFRFETEMIRIKCRDSKIPFNELKCTVINFHLAESLVAGFNEVDVDKDGFIDFDDISSSLPASVEFGRRDYLSILSLVKQQPISREIYADPISYPNYDSWTEEGLFGAITGGRPKLGPRKQDRFFDDKIEIAELIQYFNQTLKGQRPRNTFLINTFKLDQFF